MAVEHITQKNLNSTNDSLIKATSTGNVTVIGSYTYHSFTNYVGSGTFTPTQNINVDLMVVAGGGAGGNY